VKYSIVTFGCRVNQADSSEMEAELLAHGGESTDAQHADLVVVNTCSVTSASDQGARQIIRKIARENPTARIIVTGCYATRQPAELASLPGVVKVVPNDRKDFFAAEIGLTTAGRFGDGDGPCGAEIVPGTAGRTAYTLRVQTGCDETCAYCIIPSTRGKGRSRPVDFVLAEIERVCAAGFREIALTGVHLGSYGRDLGTRTSLLGLLRTIEERAPAGVRFRISSLEPMDCSDEIVDLVSGSRHFAPHFHLPLQHASDRMLVAMRRPYTVAYYRRLVDRIRERIPHASIGSDVIVGFPGETEAHFAELEGYLAVSPLTHVHVFPYSDRPGTDATVMKDKVHGSIVRARAARLRDVSRGLTAAFHRGQDGAIRPALTIDDGSTAVTDNYLKVHIGPGRSRNEWVQLHLRLEREQFHGEVLTAMLPLTVPEISAAPPR
jgi:threonylcarbamoyladenosine tRNA methylthiotransferase MtaB